MKPIITLIVLLLSSVTWGQVLNNLSNSQKVEHFYKNSSKDDMSLVTEFYHADAVFKDPVGEVKGAENLKAYYSSLYENLKEIKFEFPKTFEAKDTVIATWIMTISTESLNGGEPVRVEGSSVITFDADGKAIYHRDYFDLGEMVYEHIPFVGFLVRKVKKRLQAH
jgi:ketosteroid isomerase-like protein